MRQTGRRDVEHEITLVVTVAGGSPYSVALTDTVPHQKSPLLGDVLSITVSPDDPMDVTIDWDQAPDLAARARSAAAAVKDGDVAGAAEALGFTLKDPPPGT